MTVEESLMPVNSFYETIIKTVSEVKAITAVSSSMLHDINIALITYLLGRRKLGLLAWLGFYHVIGWWILPTPANCSD
jgi:hypothetical protein